MLNASCQSCSWHAASSWRKRVVNCNSAVVLHRVHQVVQVLVEQAAQDVEFVHAVVGGAELERVLAHLVVEVLHGVVDAHQLEDVADVVPVEHDQRVDHLALRALRVLLVQAEVVEHGQRAHLLLEIEVEAVRQTVLLLRLRDLRLALVQVARHHRAHRLGTLRSTPPSKPNKNLADVSVLAQRLLRGFRFANINADVKKLVDGVHDGVRPHLVLTGIQRIVEALNGGVLIVHQQKL